MGLIFRQLYFAVLSRKSFALQIHNRFHIRYFQLQIRLRNIYVLVIINKCYSRLHNNFPPSISFKMYSVCSLLYLFFFCCKCPVNTFDTWRDSGLLGISAPRNLEHFNQGIFPDQSGHIYRLIRAYPPIAQGVSAESSSSIRPLSNSAPGSPMIAPSMGCPTISP